MSSELAALAVLAMGGVTVENSVECFRAGASGVAAIRLFGDASKLSEIVTAVRQAFYF